MKYTATPLSHIRRWHAQFHMTSAAPLSAKETRIRNTTGRVAELRLAAVCRVVCVKRSDCNVTSENKLVPLIFKS